ncbi:uncharacterized protein [Gossypium hirsutum]|uniref:Tf2-1-like SH3-like domain-containing protein n=1 Tax=Gossypium hirsutum TaxID=3635 RepID=A0A1U8KPD2_GOSHI|nr:uncharacterized protein LOC107919374 [Gossypium hirsutum]
MVELICERLKVASDRQKSYTNLRCQDIEYQVGDKLFPKASPWTKVLRFGRKGKLSPGVIHPYEVIEWIGLVAYHLLLPPEIERIHNVFLVSMLRRYRSDHSHVVPIKEIEVRSDLSYEEEPAAILDCEIKVLRSKTVPLMKVLWHNHKIE